MELRTLEELDRNGVNNFDLIRFCAATLVIFSHAYLVTNAFAEEPLHKLVGFLNFGSAAVFVFFTVSGYLITKSFFKQKNIERFIRARILRIFPALTACSLICALILGPALSSLPVNEYFKSIDIYRFSFGNATMLDMHPYLPGVFVQNHYPAYVNSPLWTLKGEILMYIAVLYVGVIYLYKTGEKNKIKLPLITAVSLYLVALQLTLNYVFKSAALWILFFIVGMLAYAFRSRLVLKRRYLAIAWVLVISAVLSQIPGYKILVCATLAYSVFVIAYHPNLQMGAFSKYGDFSYGLYIYAFPVQQILVETNPTMSALTNFFVAYGTVLPIAMLSWHLIEKPALSLKDASQFRK